MAAPMTRKRAAPEGAFPEVPAGEKRERYQFEDIYNYVPLVVLGQSSYGVVVMVGDLRTGQIVAVKWIRHGGDGTTDVRAVYREARCLAACSGHPSVVQIKEVAADHMNGDVFIVMEFVGPSLRSLLMWPLSEAHARGFMHQLLRGAEKMHSAGIIHRDIKPANILVMATPVEPAWMPYPEEVVRTLWYRAPELVMGSQTYAHAVDMWSLGCIMFELLTGEPMFLGAQNEADMLTRTVDVRIAMKTSTECPALDELTWLSEAGREILCVLLRYKLDQQLTVAQALGHRWFVEEDAPTFGVPPLLVPPPAPIGGLNNSL